MKNEILFKTVGNIDNWNIERPAPGRPARLGRVLVKWLAITIGVILILAALAVALQNAWGSPVDILL